MLGLLLPTCTLKWLGILSKQFEILGGWSTVPAPVDVVLATPEVSTFSFKFGRSSLFLKSPDFWFDELLNSDLTL